MICCGCFLIRWILIWQGIGSARSYPYLEHLWSLCVEEQFYLFWPWIIVFTSKKRIPHILFGMIAFGISYKILGASVFSLGWGETNSLLFGCIDSLAMGALFAYYYHYKESFYPQLNTLVKIGCFIGIPMFILLQLYKLFVIEGTFRQDNFYKAIIDLSISLPSISIIYFATKNSKNLLGKILAVKPLRYVGRISYGGYLYHKILIALPIAFLIPPIRTFTGFDAYFPRFLIRFLASWLILDK